MTREEKIALLIDELEDIRCDNFDADTDEDKTLKEVVRVIKALEQEPKTGHWIPVSENLPKPKETENLIAKYYLVQNEYGDMLVARWDGKGWEQMYQHEYLEDDVIAWRPLPEPMKAESEGKG